MTALRSVPLVNHGLIVDEYWLVHYVPGQPNWDIREIEIFWDRERTQLKSDDIKFDSLPKDSQTSILAELNLWLADKRRRLHGVQRLMADIQSNAVMARVPSLGVGKIIPMRERTRS
jgi:hypothetical protein